MNRLLKFFYRYQNQRRIHTWASFWTVIKMAWAQSGRSSNFCELTDNLTVPVRIAINECKEDEYVQVIFSNYTEDKLKSLTDEEYKHFMDSLEENEELMISLSNI